MPSHQQVPPQSRFVLGERIEPNPYDLPLLLIRGITPGVANSWSAKTNHLLHAEELIAKLKSLKEKL